MINIGAIKRDLFLLGSLILMGKVAMNRQKTEVVPPVLYAPAQQAYITRAIPLPELVEEPIVAVIPEETAPVTVAESKKDDEAFTAHQPSADIMEQIDLAQAHIDQLLALVKSTTKQAA